MQHMWPPQLRRNERDGFQTSAGAGRRDGGDPEVTTANLLTSSRSPMEAHGLTLVSEINWLA